MVLLPTQAETQITDFLVTADNRFSGNKQGWLWKYILSTYLYSRYMCEVIQDNSVSAV